VAESTKLLVKSEKFRAMTAAERCCHPGYTHTDGRDLSNLETMILGYTKDGAFRNGVGWPVTLLFMQAGFLFHHTRLLAACLGMG